MKRHVATVVASAWVGIPLLGVALASACNNDRPPAQSSSLGGPSSIPGTGPSGGSTARDASTDAPVSCAPPFTCTPDAAAPAPTTKPGAGIGPDPSTLVGPCPAADGVATYGTSGLLATGPTPEFRDAYNAALARAGAGAFVIRLEKVDAAGSGAGHTAYVGGAMSSTTSTADALETGGAYPYSITAQRAVSLARAEAPFHLAFTNTENAAGDIAVSAFAMTGTLSTDCTQATLTATLYIAEAEGADPFGGSTLGELLGTPTDHVGGGTFRGWAVPLSGSSTEVTIP